ESIMMEDNKEHVNKIMVFYDVESVEGLITAQEEEYRPISDLFDYYYENRSCTNIKYNIREVEDNQRKQLFKLLKNNSDL
ncbi:10246_t:CDS:1, partial [Racocetra persica]